MNNDMQQPYEFEDFRLDHVRGALFRGEEVVNLTPKAVEILRLLVEKRGEIVSKDEIFAKVWTLGWSRFRGPRRRGAIFIDSGQFSGQDPPACR